jgi:hypothetical protein
MYNVRQEMAEMDNSMYEAWYNWRNDTNYDNYNIEEQIDLWDDFKEYYESIELDDSESESQYEQQFDEDYDY